MIEDIGARTNARRLVQAFRQRNVRQMYDPGGALAPTIDAIDEEWFGEDHACPSFDFGDLLNPLSKGSLREEFTKAMLEDAFDSGAIRLPFAKCIFRYNDRSEIPVPLLALLRETDFGFRADTFIEVDGGFVRNYANIEYRGGREYLAIVNGKSDEGHSQEIAEIFMRNVATCCAILASPQATALRDVEVPRKKPGQRINTKALPIPATRTVHFDRAKYVRPEPAPKSSVTTGSKTPHDRRGHPRTLKSGKTVWVRSCVIHGGGSEPPEYHVVS